MPLLEVQDISVRYGKEPVLSNISFSLEKGETIAVIGPNGSGKTTLFRALLGTVPFEGEIVWGEKEISNRVKIGYVPQKLDLERNLPLTIKEFLSLHPLAGERASYSLKEVLGIVGLDPKFLEKNLGSLSAGQFQRALIAFALIGKPGILLFDEPTASIDLKGEETLYDLLHRLQDIHRFGMILISHDLTFVYRYADKVLCLNKKQLCFGIPQEVLTPQELERLYGTGGKFYHHIHGS